MRPRCNLCAMEILLAFSFFYVQKSHAYAAESGLLVYERGALGTQDAPHQHLTCSSVCHPAPGPGLTLPPRARAAQAPCRASCHVSATPVLYFRRGLSETLVHFLWEFIRHLFPGATWIDWERIGSVCRVKECYPSPNAPFKTPRQAVSFVPVRKWQIRNTVLL